VISPATPILTFSTAEIVFALSAGTDGEFAAEPALQPFVIAQSPEVQLIAHNGRAPGLAAETLQPVFDSGAVWALHRAGHTNVVSLRSPVVGPDPYRTAVFSEDYCYGEIFTPTPPAGGRYPHPLEYPLGEVLLVCLLGLGRGVMTHACGLDDQGRGYLFAGCSGHGKSTLARLWHGRARLLNDDRIVIRRRQGRFWMYGTPWHGEVHEVSPDPVPLERVFFLRHARRHSITPVSRTTALSALLVRAFPPLWDREGMGYTLDILGQVVGSVPCHWLDFAPETSIVDFVHSLS
jgi:hypothetical protein